MVNNVHEIFNAAREMYDILTGDVVLYVDDYGMYWTNAQDAGENARPATPEEFINSANDVQVKTNNDGIVIGIILIVDSPSNGTKVKIESIDCRITAYNYGEEVSLSYDAIDEVFPLSDTIEELHENGFL